MLLEIVAAIKSIFYNNAITKQILHQPKQKHYSDQLSQHLQNAITLFAKHLAFDVEGTKPVTDSFKHFAGLFELD